MLHPPDKNEWDTSSLTQERREYLDRTCAFEQIAAQLVSEATICGKPTVKPYGHVPKGVPKETRQIVFRLIVCRQTYDLFFNAADGLRGRYWQSAEAGDQATRFLIQTLMLKFLATVTKTPPAVIAPAKEMTFQDIQLSLNKPSAKIWVFENEQNAIDTGRHVLVARWAQNESKLCCSGNVGPQWRWEKVGNQIEVKGALIRPDKNEEIPASKMHRAYQIHQCGFT